MLHVGVQILQTADLRVENQGLGLPVEGEVSAASGAVEVRLFHPFDLHFSDGATHPFGGIWFGCLQKNLCSRLRKHDLSEVAVDDFQLCFALEIRARLDYAICGSP